MKLKKIFVAVCTVLCVGTALAALSGCAQEHEHVYGEWAIEKESTCIENGVKARMCECGDKETEIITAIGHTDGTWIIDKNATCTMDGSRRQVCSICDETIETVAIPAIGHTDGTWIIDKNATCTMDGSKRQVCSICDETIETVTIPATGHTDGEWITDKNATCTLSGSRHQICVDCSETIKTETFQLETIPATDIYNEAKNVVGEIVTYDKNGSELALGTGFIYGSDGKIMTNYHVIEDAISAKITLDGKTYDVESILAYDAEIDLAVLKISASNLPTLKVCTKEHAVGMLVYALGSSKGLTSTFSEGIITYANREMDGVSYIQHDAAISSGNSGGPLINQYSEVIGINTMTVKDSQNLNFAISAQEIVSLVFGDPISFDDLFGEKEPIVTDEFTLMKNYIISKGTYSASNNNYTLTLGYSYSSDYSSKYTRKAVYYVEDGTIFLEFFIDNSNVLMLMIDSIDSIYAWGYGDSYGYEMIGLVTASTFNSNTILSYSSTNIYSSSLKTATRELASAMLVMLLLYFDTDFAAIGVTAQDLGFYYF